MIFKYCVGPVLALSLGSGIAFAAQEQLQASNAGLFQYFTVNGQRVEAGANPQSLLHALGKPLAVNANDAECGGVLEDSDRILVYTGATFEADAQEVALNSLDLAGAGNEVVIADQHVNGKMMEASFKQRFKGHLLLDEDGGAFFSFEDPAVREAGLQFRFKDGFVSHVENWVGC